MLCLLCLLGVLGCLVVGVVGGCVGGFWCLLSFVVVVGVGGGVFGVVGGFWSLLFAWLVFGVAVFGVFGAGVAFWLFWFVVFVLLLAFWAGLCGLVVPGFGWVFAFVRFLRVLAACFASWLVLGGGVFWLAFLLLAVAFSFGAVGVVSLCFGCVGALLVWLLFAVARAFLAG